MFTPHSMHSILSSHQQQLLTARLGRFSVCRSALRRELAPRTMERRTRPEGSGPGKPLPSSRPRTPPHHSRCHPTAGGLGRAPAVMHVHAARLHSPCRASCHISPASVRLASRRRSVTPRPGGQATPQGARHYQQHGFKVMN